MAASNDLPPIGSLWLHRESGERRFVMGCGENRVYFSIVRWESAVTFYSGDDLELHDTWLAWQAGAVRIDREEA